MRLGIAAVLSAVLTVSAAEVQKPQAGVKDLGFLAGPWRTEVWGGAGDEVWTAPEAGNMVGVWRFIKDGKLVFTEHMSIEDEPGGGAVLRLKHFRPGMKGVEEKDQSIMLPLDQFAPGDAQFASEKDGKRTVIRYRAPRANELECTLVKIDNDKREETLFRMKRVVPARGN